MGRRPILLSTGRLILLSMGVLVSFAAPRRRGGRRRFIEDAMQVPLIAPLFDGAIDVVGDVHGEFGALRATLVFCARVWCSAREFGVLRASLVLCVRVW